MDAGIALTAAGTIVAIVGSNIALIGWLRSDMKAFETEVRMWKEDFRKDIAIYKDEVKSEMRDFHGRLCAIEEKNKK